MTQGASHTARALLSILACLVITVEASAEIIRIRVLDGRDGRPIRDERVQVWLASSPKVLSISTDKNGIGQFDAGEDSSFEIESNIYLDCRPFRKGVPRPSYSVVAVLKDGLVTPNTCGHVKTEPTLGEIVFYVRPLHWWEGIKR
jgi:hypothetical protein